MAQFKMCDAKHAQILLANTSDSVWLPYEKYRLLLLDSGVSAKRIPRKGAKKVTHACGICPKKYISELNLIRHLSKVHLIHGKTQEPYTCACGDKFQNDYEFSVHLVEDGPEKLYECYFCAKKYNAKKGLTQHLLLLKQH